MAIVGTVTKWFPAGFGFVQASDGTDAYVSQANIINGYALTVGETVNFDIDPNQQVKPNGKIAASNVQGPGVVMGQQGIVKSFNALKKYGFIATADGQSYFVHARNVQGTGLVVGEPVNFSISDVGHESGKLQATNVQGKGVIPRGKLKCTVKNWLGKYGFVVDKLGNEIFIHTKEIGGGSLTLGGDVYCDSYTKDDGNIAGTNVSGSGVVQGTAPSVQQSMQTNPGAYGGMGPQVTQMVQAPMTLTSANGEEMRMDTDGQFYTRTQFIEQYGGIREFNNAPRMVVGGGKGRGRGGFGAMGGRMAGGGGGRVAGMGGITMGNKFSPYST